MSSKTQYLGVPGAHRSQAADVLNTIIAQSAADKRASVVDARDERRFQLQMDRQAKQDALANARLSLADKRYNDGLARDKQNKEDILSGLVLGASTQFDPTSTETVSVKDTDATVKQYETDKINETFKDLTFEEEGKKLTQEELAMVTSYEDLAKIENPYERKRAELRLAKGMFPNENYEKDGFFDKMEKVRDRVGVEMVGGLATAANPVVNLFRDEEDSINADEAIDDFKTRGREDTKFKSYSGALQDRIGKLQTRKTTNTGVRDRNQKKLDSIDTVMEKYSKDVYDGKTMKDQVLTKSRSAYMKDSRNQADTAIQAIQNSKESTTTKINAIKEILDRKKMSDNVHKEALAAEVKRVQAALERAQKNDDARGIALYKAQLKDMGDASEFTRKSKDPKYQADLKYVRSRTKRTDNQTKNNK